MDCSWQDSIRSPSLGYSSASSDESSVSPDASLFVGDDSFTIDPKQILQGLEEEEDVTQYLATSLCDYNIWNGCKTVSPLVHPMWEDPQCTITEDGLGIRKSTLVLKKSKAIENWYSAIASCSTLKHASLRCKEIDMETEHRKLEHKELEQKELERKELELERKELERENRVCKKSQHQKDRKETLDCNDEEYRDDELDEEYNEEEQNCKRKKIRVFVESSGKRKRSKKRKVVDMDAIFDCDKCEKSFKRQEHLKRHFRSVHTTVKPYSCPRCCKVFSRSDNLAQHVRVHSKNRFF